MKAERVQPAGNETQRLKLNESALKLPAGRISVASAWRVAVSDLMNRKTASAAPSSTHRVTSAKASGEATQMLRANRAIAAKADIGTVAGRLGLSGTSAAPVGDDCAAIRDGDGYLLFAIEGFMNEFVAGDPRFAGWLDAPVSTAQDTQTFSGRNRPARRLLPGIALTAYLGLRPFLRRRPRRSLSGGSDRGAHKRACRRSSQDRRCVLR
jgi:hypothetical protein